MINETIKNFELLFIYVIIFFNSFGLNFYEIPNNLVIKVIDGDTIEVHENQKIEKIRLIGINSPESVDPKRKIQCFGIESSKKLKEILQNKIVNLKEDPSQGNRDKFGRKLRYVYLDDLNINKKLLEEGYAFEYTYKKPYLFQKEFQNTESFAKQNQVGLWNKNNCDY